MRNAFCRTHFLSRYFIIFAYILFTNTFLFGQTPTISSFSPVSQLAGENVTINGTNFGGVKANVTVKFGGSTATIVSCTSTKIVATVPSNAKSGTIGVTVSGQSEVTISGFVFMKTIDALYTDYNGYWFSSRVITIQLNQIYHTTCSPFVTMVRYIPLG